MSYAVSRSPFALKVLLSGEFTTAFLRSNIHLIARSSAKVLESRASRFSNIKEVFSCEGRANSVASDYTNSFRIALCVSGGIAAYKAAEVLRGLQQAGCEVRVCMSARATEFISPLTFRALSGAHVVTNDYAPDNPDPIAHITFSQSIDLLLVAPATANIIAKFANGIADDFLSSTYLAANAPVAVAPAMNTTMWEHPATTRNLERLRADGVHIIEPDAGEMACGTIGAGRLAEPARIVAAAMDILRSKGRASSASVSSAQDLAGERILITAGGTREAIDPVRFISNHSQGAWDSRLPNAPPRVVLMSL
jgi:phosphopantothenoylcysteine decarboxylase/phosphopantothenate--cysteine ligase